jgi:hypothetical protein
MHHGSQPLLLTGAAATLPPTEFIGRFLLHILPDRFVKIRHFGLQASSNVSTTLARARDLPPAPVATPSTATTATKPHLLPPSIQLCPGRLCS